MQERIQEAARRLARRADELREAKRAEAPALNVIQLPQRPARQMDGVERESRLRWMRALVRAYRPFGMDLIWKQALIGKHSADDLSDDELMQLHRDIDRARECLADGITFEEAGLLRSHGEVA